MINKKALGAVVATSLLLVVAVAAVVAFQSYFLSKNSKIGNTYN